MRQALTQVIYEIEKAITGKRPVIEKLLADWGIENPWRDLVNREDIYLIDHDIDRSLAFLRRWYYPEAEAELIEPLSRETGLMVYRITG